MYELEFRALHGFLNKSNPRKKLIAYISDNRDFDDDSFCSPQQNDPLKKMLQLEMFKEKFHRKLDK